MFLRAITSLFVRKYSLLVDAWCWDIGLCIWMHNQVKANPQSRSGPAWRPGPPWRYTPTSKQVRCPRFHQPLLTYLWRQFKKQFWLVNAGERPQQYVPYNEIGVRPQECSLLPRHLSNLCLEKRCCETRCLDVVFDEWLRMVFDNDNFLRPDRNFPKNCPEMKGFFCPQREE